MEYIAKGRGRPVVLFHGTPGGSDHILLFQKLADWFFLASPSRPGYLGTKLNIHTSSITMQASLLASFMDRLNISKAVLLAHSGGGPVALEFAASYPEKTLGLVLCSALVKGDRLGLVSRLLWQDWILKFLGAVSSKYTDYTKLLVPKAARIQGFKNDAKNYKNLPVFDFSRIHCPTLILHDARDKLVPFEHAQLARTGIANSKLVKLNGGHLLILGPDKDKTFHEARLFIEHI